MNKRIVVALGGNAILQPKQSPTYLSQLENVKSSCKTLVKVIESGYDLVVSHGNGPQVGNLLVQNEEAGKVIPPMPLDVLTAQTQGFIGYMLQESLANEFKDLNIKKEVATILTRVEVDENDPLFQNPTKPIGVFYSKQEAEKLKKEKGFILKEDAGRGFRRVVPSPIPKSIVEIDTIKSLVDSGAVIIAGGGGGIPVVYKDGKYSGVEAVIDKDLSTAKLAEELEADIFVILTDVENVYVNYNKEDQKALSKVSIKEMQDYLEEGQFAGGSMKPKVEAAVKFVKHTGKKAYICSLDKISEVLAGNGGTEITE